MPRKNRGRKTTGMKEIIPNELTRTRMHMHMQMHTRMVHAHTCTHTHMHMNIHMHPRTNAYLQWASVFCLSTQLQLFWSIGFLLNQLSEDTFKNHPTAKERGNLEKMDTINDWWHSSSLKVQVLPCYVNGHWTFWEAICIHSRQQMN